MTKPNFCQNVPIDSISAVISETRQYKNTLISLFDNDENIKNNRCTNSRGQIATQSGDIYCICAV